jgi:hypothetical protein
MAYTKSFYQNSANTPVILTEIFSGFYLSLQIKCQDIILEEAITVLFFIFPSTVFTIRPTLEAAKHVVVKALLKKRMDIILFGSNRYHQ